MNADAADSPDERSSMQIRLMGRWKQMIIFFKNEAHIDVKSMWASFLK